MKVLFVVALMMTAPTGMVFAQGATPPPRPQPIVRAAGETLVPGKCLYKEDLDLIEKRRALTRTTLNDDAPAPFNPDYLIGRWTFEYDTPESALGPAGQVSGTETIQYVDGCMYEGTLQAKGPAGAFTIKSTFVYDPSAHYLVVLERDSRGFDLLKQGRVGGDSGGYFTHHWTAAPLSVNGKKVKLKGSTFMASPANYRVRTEIAEGDEPFVSLGTLWVQRQESADKK